VRRLVSLTARAGFATACAMLALALLRWAPVYARPPLAVGALPLLVPLALLGALAARTGVPRSAGPWRLAASVALASLVALAAVTAVRGPGGLAAVVEGRDVALAVLAPGPIDLVPDDLADIERPRRIRVRWSGELRAPASGQYLFHASGRGRIELDVDGETWEAAGEPLEASRLLPLGRGSHRLEVVYEHAGPGPRLRLDWTPPRASGQPGERRELVPPRLLGPPGAAWAWSLTDVLALAFAAGLGLLVWWLPWEVPRRLPKPAPVTGREAGMAFLGQIGILVAMSWPLATQLSSAGPFGQPDGRLNAWILAWDVHALLTKPAQLFQAPIFHPLPDALAFSENLLLPAVVTAPMQLLGGAALAYNAALLLSYALSGLAVYLLVRRATRDAAAAFLAGSLFATGIHRWINMAHLHVQMTPFLPLTLLALDRFWERRSLARALLVGLCLALQGASSVNLSVITGTVLAVTVALAVAAGLRAKELARLLAGLAVAAVLLAPLVRPYLRMRAFQGEEFSLDYVATFAATPESYVASAAPWYAGLTGRHLDPERVRDPLFPGLVPVALGLVGLARAPRRFAAAALATSFVAVVLSLGPETVVYRALHENLVLLRGLRALVRFSIVPVLALCVLAGCAVAGRRRLALAGLVLGLLESWNGPFAFAPYRGPSELARALAAGAGPVAELPLGEDDTAVMLDGIAHFRPLVNGDSGFMPRGYSRAMEQLDGPIGPDAFRLLRGLGVRQLVLREDPGLPLVARFAERAIYELPEGPVARPVAAAPPRPSMAAPSGFVIDMGSEQSVSRLVFELSESPWIAAPTVEGSTDGRSWTTLDAQADLADAVLSLYADPRHGLGEVRFSPQRLRFLRLDRRLPARPGTFGAGP